MSRPNSFAFVLFAAAALLPFSCASAQNAHSYRAGLKDFSIPAPSSALVEAGADYRVLMEPLAPVNNRLVAAFLETADLDAIRSGAKAPLNRYALVEIPRRAEFTEVSPEQFKQVADNIAAQFGASFDSSLKDEQDEINRRLKALNSSSATVTLDKPLQLGTLFNKPDAAAYGMIMPISSEGKTKKMVMGMVVLRVQSRVLFAYTYTEYKDESSVQWIRTTDESWADSILAANK